MNTNCPEDYRFFEGACMLCASISEYIYPNCSDICGTGVLYNFTNNLQCNDGNLITGDGCSATCQVEPNYKCIRYNQTTPDKCFDISPLTMSIVLTSSANLMYLQFNRPIMNYSIENTSIPLNFTDLIQITLDKLTPNNYNYNIQIYDTRTLKVQFLYSVSFSNIMVFVNVSQTNSLQIRDENNITFSGFDQQIITNYNNTNSNSVILNDTFSTYIYQPDEIHDQINEIYQATMITSYSSFLFSSLPFFWLNLLQFLWFMLDSMQISNFFLYLNVYLPENAVKILGMFAQANLYFLSDFFNYAFGMHLNTNSLNNQINPSIEAPEKFNDFGISSLFLKNAGGFVVIIIFLYFCYGLLKLLSYLQKKKFQKQYIENFLLTVKKYFKHPVLLRIQSIFFLSLCLATCLQFRSFSTLSTHYFYNYIFCFFSFIYIVWLFIMIFKISNNEFTYFQDKSYLTYYSTVFKESNLEILLGRNYFLLINIKKLILAMVVVFLYDYPYVEISLLLAGELLSIYIVFKESLFKSKWMNIFVRFSEIMFFLALIIVLAMEIYSQNYLNQSGELPQEYVDTLNALGWVLVAFVLSIIGFFLCILNWAVIKGIGKLVRKAKQLFEEFRKKRERMQEIPGQSPHNEEDVSSDNHSGISKIM